VDGSFPGVWQPSSRRKAEAAERAKHLAVAESQATSSLSTARATWVLVALAVPAAVVAAVTLWPRSTDPQVSVAQALVVSPDERTSPITPGYLDVTLRNSGKSLAVLVGAEVRIDEFVALESCASGSDIPISGSYQVQLPDRPSAGTVVRADLHQDVPADGDTRFQLSMSLPNAHDDAPLGLTALGYRLHVTLQQDGGRDPVDVGEFVIVGPHDWLPNQWQAESTTLLDGTTRTRDQLVKQYFNSDTAGAASALACYAHNQNELARLFSSPATVSARVARIREALRTGHETVVDSPDGRP